MINIAIRPGKKLPGVLNAFISFDEYIEPLIDYIRAFQDRRYHVDTKEWEVGTEHLEEFIAKAKEYSVHITIPKTENKLIHIPRNYQFKTKPFAHQIVGIEYGLNHNVFILADEQGLGKTLQLINLAAIRKQRGEVTQCLVVCGVNSIKYNWLAEISQHSSESAWVLGTRFQKSGKMVAGSVNDRIEDIKTRKEFFLITNIETFRSEDFVSALLKNKNINMIAIDEGHLIRNPQSAMSKGLLKCKNYKYKVAMSGTPIVNRPLDAYSILKWLGLENSNYSTFKQYYCSFGGFGNHQIVGYRNLGKLRETLSGNMLRRLKTDALTLPDKIEQTEYIEMSSAQWKIYNSVKNEILENIDLIAASNNPLSMLLRLRQATDYTGLLSSDVQESSKLDRLLEIVDELSQNDRKALIFSNWTSITSIVKQKLKDYNPAYITGEISNIERQNEVNRFQTDNTCKVCLGTIGAMGTGLTLTAATTVIFIDLPWHKAAYDQCSDRAHRIGQTKTVNIIKLICKDTIDEKIDDIVIKKGAMADLLVDGKVSKLTRADLLNIIG